MGGFRGFPSNTRYAAIPAAFFSDLLPQIADAAELRVSLHLFWLLSQQQGRPKAVPRSALLADGALVQSLAGGAAALDRALKAAVARGTFLATPVAGSGETAYLVNTEANRRDLALIAAGRLPVAGGRAAPADAVAPEAPLARSQPNIFQLYEDNIGLLTPLLSEELREAEARYPAEWVEEAFRLAVERNRRKWSYIAAVLERWAAEGYPGAARASRAYEPAPTQAGGQGRGDGLAG